jgi:hypothetical protein
MQGLPWLMAKSTIVRYPEPWIQMLVNIAPQFLGSTSVPLMQQIPTPIMQAFIALVKLKNVAKVAWRIVKKESDATINVR